MAASNPPRNMISNDARNCDDASDDNSAAEIENDLAILAAMDIDNDFSLWSDFRRSLAVPERRASLESLFLQSSTASKRNLNMSSLSSGLDIDGDDADDSEKDDNFKEDSEFGSSCNNVSFSSISPGELRDIRAWNIRLSREIAFSRYYFPEQWEQRELKTIANFLDLNDHEAQGLYDGPGQAMTKITIASIFSPGDHDPKSVLMKRGPILFDVGLERELMLFTHHFLLSRMEFSTLLHALFTINSQNPEYMNVWQLEDRFNAIDTDENGSLDRCELKEVFKGMGFPISESALDDIIDRFDADGDGLINFDEFQSVMLDLKPKKEENRWTLGALGQRIKRSISGSKVEPKVEYAFPLSDIQKLECVNFCQSESTMMYANSSWADLVFAVFIKDRETPLILICSKKEHCRAWVDAFRTCVVKSIQLRADSGSNEAKKLRSLLGWQHRVIRASLFSLVCIGDLAGLQRQLANPSRGSNINDQDEYHGYTALHYAVILGRMDIVKVLLQHRSRVNLQDDNGRTPLDHAMLSESTDVIRILEQNGATRNSSEELFKSAIEEQKRLKSGSKVASSTKRNIKTKDASTVNAQAMIVLHERGEKLERLEGKTAHLYTDASSFAEMTKQMKEKTKKKAVAYEIR